jgi:hypothetical protein
MALWTACGLFVLIAPLLDVRGFSLGFLGGVRDTLLWVLPQMVAAAWTVFFFLVYREGTKYSRSCGSSVAAYLIIVMVGVQAGILFNELIYTNTVRFWDVYRWMSTLQELLLFVGWSSFLALFLHYRNDAKDEISPAALLIVLLAVGMGVFPLMFEEEKMFVSANFDIYLWPFLFFGAWSLFLMIFILKTRGKPQKVASVLSGLVLALIVLVLVNGLYWVYRYGFTAYEPRAFWGHPLQMFVARVACPIAVTMAWASQIIFLWTARQWCSSNVGRARIQTGR